MCRSLCIALMMLLVGNAAHAELLYHYNYVLEENHNPEVCRHMLVVFNQKFTHLWDYPPTHWTGNPAESEYEFPALPGVRRNDEVNDEVWYSAFPTSPEFSAIHWKQGRAVPKGCPVGQLCPGEGPRRILVANFDFDNDGSVDTVIKNGFFAGYNAMFKGLEILEVWRGQTLTITDTPSLWDLAHPKDKDLTPIIMFGMYLRPFIYLHITYVASYVPRFKEKSEPNQGAGPPPYPIREDMLIKRYHFDGRKDQIGRPQWSSDTICDLQMKRLNDR